MHAVYTKDPITNKLASFKLPTDIDVKDEAILKDITDGVREEIKPGSKVPVLVAIDTKTLNAQDEKEHTQESEGEEA